MGRTKKVENIKKYKKSMNIGIIIFLFILIYLGILVVNSLTNSHLEIYAVKTETLAQDNVVTGLILREENVINATHSGYLNYYFPDNAKTTKNSVLFSIDETKTYYDLLHNTTIKEGISAYDASYINKLIESYRKNSNSSDYSKTKQFSDTVKQTVQDLSDAFSISVITNALPDPIPDTLHFYYSESSGLISYNTDTLCGIQLQNVTPEVFLLADNYAEYDRRKSIVEANTPVIKYITDDKWNILCELNESQRKSLSTHDNIEFTICEDGLQTKADFELINIDNQSYALIHMNEYVHNYLDERFLSIELHWQSTDGFKIPLTAITEKDFFVVPIQYFTKGNDNNSLGLLVEVLDEETGVADYIFKPSTIYYNDGLYYYIDPSEFQFGQKVLVPDTFTMYTIELKERLEGVYNINKGYALFRRIERITQNEEYCLVKNNTEYGLKEYDHIALNANDAVDSGIIY